MRILLALAVLVFTINSKAANTKAIPIKNGSLLLSTHPKEINKYFINEQYLAINLQQVRASCNFLTDEDILKYKSYQLPNRKKAFKRRVRKLCEELELLYFSNGIPTNTHFNKIYELETFRLSIIDKSKNNSIGIIDKISMFISSRSNSFIIKRTNRTQTKNEAKNISLPEGRSVRDFNIDELANFDPVTSPYWHPLSSKLSPNKQFSNLQRLKKIKAKSPLYVLFDATSDSGSSPKIKTIDLDMDNKWSIKWGDEIHTDVVGSRIFAALGYDVDHPYFYGKDQVIVIFPPQNTINHPTALIADIKQAFKINISPFISKVKTIEQSDIKKNKLLEPFLGFTTVTFQKCLVEARPDRVKRLGSIIPEQMNQNQRRELRGSLLAHLWIDNWDTKKENTMISLVHKGKRKYRMSGVFSDLGTSFGVKLNIIPSDFRVGLVNHYPWDIVKTKRRNTKRIQFYGKMNSIHSFFKAATYSDMKWMAKKIASLKEEELRKIVKKGNWPEPLSELYFHKLSYRREQILDSFDIENNWNFRANKKYTNLPNIENGKLIKDFKNEENPLGFLSSKGRLRNFGGKK